MAQRIALATAAYGDDRDGMRVWEPTAAELDAALGDNPTPYEISEGINRARSFRLKVFSKGCQGRRCHQWAGRYRVDGRLKATRTMTSKTRALEEARDLEQRGRTADWTGPKFARVSVGEWFEVWMS